MKITVDIRLEVIKNKIIVIWETSTWESDTQIEVLGLKAEWNFLLINRTRWK